MNMNVVNSFKNKEVSEMHVIVMELLNKMIKDTENNHLVWNNHGDFFKYDGYEIDDLYNSSMVEVVYEENQYNIARGKINPELHDIDYFARKQCDLTACGDIYSCAWFKKDEYSEPYDLIVVPVIDEEGKRSVIFYYGQYNDFDSIDVDDYDYDPEGDAYAKYTITELFSTLNDNKDGRVYKNTMKLLKEIQNSFEPVRVRSFERQLIGKYMNH